MGVQVPPGVLLIRVRSLFDYVRLMLEAEGPGVQAPVVKFLVDMYSTGKGPGLQWRMGSLSSSTGKDRHRMVGGIHVPMGSVGAIYLNDRHTLVVNDDSKGDLRKKVKDILHEIQHYNQQVRWESGDAGYRDRFTKGKQLPPDIEDDPLLLYDTSWQDMTTFWERRYGYAHAPHEVDARRFAEKKVDEALGFVEEHKLNEE